MSQVQGVFFENVTIGIDGCSDVGVSNLVLNIEDISTCALRDRDCCVYPEESERVSEWFARCTRIYEMYATGAMSVLGQYKVSPEIDIPPEDWFQNGPGLWPEGQAET